MAQETRVGAPSHIRDVVGLPGAAPTKGEAFGAFLRNYDARPRGGAGSGSNRPPGDGDPSSASTTPPEAAAPTDTPEPGQRKRPRRRQPEPSTEATATGSEPAPTTEPASAIDPDAAAAIQAARQRIQERAAETGQSQQPDPPTVEPVGGSTSRGTVPPAETVAPPPGPTRRSRPSAAGRAPESAPTTEPASPPASEPSTAEALLAAEQQRRREEDRDRLVAEINDLTTRIPTSNFNAFVATRLLDRSISLQDKSRVAPVTPEVEVAIQEGITQGLRDTPAAQRVMAEGVLIDFESQAGSLNDPSLRGRGQEAIRRTIRTVEFLGLDNPINIPFLGALMGELGSALRHGGDITDILTRGRATINSAIEYAAAAAAVAPPTEPAPAASAPHAEPAPGAHDAHAEAHPQPAGGKRSRWKRFNERFSEWLDRPRPAGANPPQPPGEKKGLVDMFREYMAGTYDSPLASTYRRPAESTQPETRPPAAEPATPTVDAPAAAPATASAAEATPPTGQDSKLPEAVILAGQNESLSVSQLRSSLKIGAARARRILDGLEAAGVVSPDPAVPNRFKVTPQEEWRVPAQAPDAAPPVLTPEEVAERARRAVELGGQINVDVTSISGDEFNRATARRLIEGVTELSGLTPADRTDVWDSLRDAVTEQLNNAPGNSPRQAFSEVVFPLVDPEVATNTPESIARAIKAVKLLGLDKNNNIAGLETANLDELKRSLNIPD